MLVYHDKLHSTLVLFCRNLNLINDGNKLQPVRQWLFLDGIKLLRLGTQIFKVLIFYCIVAYLKQMNWPQIILSASVYIQQSVHGGLCNMHARDGIVPTFTGCLVAWEAAVDLTDARWTAKNIVAFVTRVLTNVTQHWSKVGRSVWAIHVTVRWRFGKVAWMH